MGVRLYGYQFSGHLRVARLALVEKGVKYERVKLDPLGTLPETYLELHPFGRVPVLRHDGFTLYEAQAIGRYVDGAFAGPALQPEDSTAQARMA